MNVSAKSSGKLPWRKIIPVAVVLLILGYQAGRPTLERVFQVSLPAIGGNEEGGHASGDNDRERDPNQQRRTANANDYEASLPPTANPGSDQNTAAKTTGGSGFKLKEVGRNRFESPAGLLYTMGSGGEHRIDHVMRHARDMPNRPAHGVFVGDGDQDAVLQILDDAWTLVKNDSPKVSFEKSRGNDLYHVDMGRKIGFEGGQKGKRSNNRSLNRVRMVLDGNRVITAFPVR